MDRCQEKVKFYFDKNVWSDIVNMTDVERRKFEDLIKPLRNESKIGIWYSPISVLESIRGMLLEIHYEKCRDEIKLASVITDKHLLENPWDHVRRSAYAFAQKPFKEPDLSFLNLCREIVVFSYRQIEQRIAPIRDLLMKWQKDWADSLNGIKSSFRNDFGFLQREKVLTSKAKRFVEDEWITRRTKRAWKSFCQHYSLPRELENWPLDRALTVFHSFRYWVDYRLTYEKKLLFDNKKPSPSDYLDWEQIVYLNIMDYLVTNDRGLITILNECKNRELNKVSMRFKEFLDCLKGKLPPRRAPNDAFKKWYDVKQF